MNHGDFNPASIEEAIQDTTRRIEEGVALVDAAYREFQKADLAFDVAEAKAVLSAQGAVDARKKQTVLDTVEDRVARDAAEAAYKLMDRNMKALEKKLDAYRSIGASVRQAYSQGIS